MQDLFASGKYSDVTVIVCGKKYALHQAVLCPRSTFFAKACDGDFMEGMTGIIEIKDDDPEALHMMLQYLYVSDYSTDTPSGGSNTANSLAGVAREPGASLVAHARVYGLADFYGVSGLQEVALAKFWNELHSFKDTQGFLLAAEVVYTSTPDADRGLRNLIVEKLQQCPSLVRKTEWQEVLKRRSSMAFDLVVEFSKYAR